MTTPDVGAPVGDGPYSSLAGVPTSAETPNLRAASPGIALAQGRVPGAPTLPDWDAGTRLVAGLANELFGAMQSSPVDAPAGGAIAPPAAAGDSTGSVAAPSAPASLSSVPVVDSVAPAGAPTQSPFSEPLRFDGIGLPFAASDATASSFSIPLFDVTESAPAAPQEGLPWGEASAPTPALNTERLPYELTPTVDQELRSQAGTPFDPRALRREFPILHQRVNGRPLVWLDNAATTQKPRAVIDRLTRFYEHENSNVHRAAHTLAARATDAYESARESVRRFVNAPSVKDIVFVRGTTEGINFIAQSWGRRNIGPGDEVVITWLEHHANIVPWQMLCSEKGARLRVAPVDDRGQILLAEYEKLLGPKTKLVSLSQVSNALGTVTPAKDMVELAHRHGAKVVVDGAQSVSHRRTDVQALDCDFFVFSGHKVFGPTGIGAVYGKQSVLEETPPWQGGGNMIQDVTFERTVYQGPPARFEAGTGNIADAVGLGAALDWLSRVGIENVDRYEHELLEYGTAKLATVPGLTMIGTAPNKAGVLSFILAGQKTEEVGGMLDKEGIAVRSGHHCAQPILRRFGLEATVRASLAPYNTTEDLDALVDALKRIQSGRG
jgi:cysteine desulfurase/selenocysteine lyase